MGMRGLTESLPPGLGALGPRGSACPGDKSPASGVTGPLSALLPFQENGIIFKYDEF